VKLEGENRGSLNSAPRGRVARTLHTVRGGLEGPPSSIRRAAGEIFFCELAFFAFFLKGKKKEGVLITRRSAPSALRRSGARRKAATQRAPMALFYDQNEFYFVFL